MSYEKKDITIKLSPCFQKAFKKLAKKYRSLAFDLDKLILSLQKDPTQGIDLGYGLHKIRMVISTKGKGKSGGARIITYTMLLSEEGSISLLTIYDKSEKESISDKELKELIKEYI